LGGEGQKKDHGLPTGRGPEDVLHKSKKRKKKGREEEPKGAEGKGHVRKSGSGRPPRNLSRQNLQMSIHILGKDETGRKKHISPVAGRVSHPRVFQRKKGKKRVKQHMGQKLGRKLCSDIKRGRRGFGGGTRSPGKKKLNQKSGDLP